MRRALIFGGLVLVGLVALGWATGALDGLAAWIAAAQRAAQERLAGVIRALRGGEPGALAAFWAVCFGYGVLHAAGPGHGKLIIGGYGIARRVPVGRLAGLALVSSLAQAAVAVALVYAVLAVLGLGRTAVEGAAERWVTPVGHAMIAGLGLWLVWRGARGVSAGLAAEGGAITTISTGTTISTITGTTMRATTMTTGTGTATPMSTGRTAGTPMARPLTRSRRSGAGGMARCWWRASRCGPVRGRCSSWS